MDPIKPSDVIAGLPNWTPEELRELQSKATALLTLTPASKRVPLRVVRGGAGPDEFARDLYEALADDLHRRTAVASMPYLAFAGTRMYERFLSSAGTAARANASWFPRQTRAERLSMVRLYAKLVLDSVARRERPAVWANICDALDDLPEVVDRAFPGYAAAGLLGKVQALRTAPRRQGASPV